mmetsp:Transcript_35898/g.107222  ORF Transcript_35898/g.107222 Transcript_35898/m.107222 type:complete len:207 (+) Transcript_35898:100-720(+)
MARKKPTKYVGSCGIYVFAGARLLVHRRSHQVSEPNTICAPGGIVERSSCGPDGTEFHEGARTTAVRELLEETGIRLGPAEVEALTELPVGEGTYWGPSMHRNFCALLDGPVPVTGPEKASRHEVVWEGMRGVGEPAGDGYHSWVDARELLRREDLMLGCRVPLAYIVENVFQTIPADMPAEEDAEQEEPPPLKRARGTIGLAPGS